MGAIMVAMGLVVIGQQVGQRPYEMVWAGRDQDEYPVLIDFEDLSGWTVETSHAVASWEPSREQQMYGQYVGKLTYRADGSPPVVTIRPPEPIPCPTPFDTVTLWVYGNNWGWIHDPTTPRVTIQAHFQAADGTDVVVDVYYVNAQYWFLAYRKLTPEQVARVRDGAAFTGFSIVNGRNTDDRTIYLDSFAVFQEVLAPLTFAPRAQRGIDMLPGADVGTNTGEGRLPFPTRAETILPTNLTPGSESSVAVENDTFVFIYRGADGVLRYRLRPQTGMWDDLSAAWEGRGDEIRPCVGGGVWLVGPAGTAVAPETVEPLGTEIQRDEVVSRWRLGAGEASAEVAYTYRLWGKSLVIDVAAPGGGVAEVRWGRAVGLTDPRVAQIPYYVYSPGRPHVAVSGPPDAPLFLMGNICWYLSGASSVFGAGGVEANGVLYNGGTRYLPKTNGVRNDVHERFFLTISPRFEEVLPNIPNPISPWKHVTGTGVWRAHGAGNRERDAAFWREAHRYGMRHLIITDHETGWRDEGESFTFRTRTAPGKGGDEGQYQYARIMQDELGFVYGPYNNYTDFAPVNEYWHADMVARHPDGQLQTAWPRCYAPKPARAVEYCERLAPIIQEKFRFSTAYCDVHTAVAPWHRTDYDARVPGAGTFAATFYSYGEIMLHQKQAWDGPVYSEGNHHAYYCGLTDGNYAQDQNARLPVNPWLVDFDLLKMHDLCCNFGMGNPDMFYGDGASLAPSQADLDFNIDRFLAATVAFGHPGFLVYEGGLHNALRSYYMIQQLAASYTQSPVAAIRYVDGDGNLLETSAAIAGGVFRRSQLVTTYQNGTVTVANGSLTERLRAKVGDRTVDLPPAGYAGWTADGSVDVFAGQVDGHRIDYADTPEYIYLDGRGRWTRMPKAAGRGVGICRVDEQGGWEVILFRGAECGFRLGPCTAVALDRERNVIGPAEVRVSRDLTYVVPVDGAFSYRLTPTPQAPPALTCDRTDVIAGETVTVHGREDHLVQIPSELQPGDRHWVELEGGWIDFTVAPLAGLAARLDGTRLLVDLTPNVPAPLAATIRLGPEEVRRTLEPQKAITVGLDLGEPTDEGVETTPLQITAGELRQSAEWTTRIVLDRPVLAVVPETYDVGMCYRGQAETQDMGESRAFVSAQTTSSGGSARKGLFMHPPWVGGVGYVYALLSPVALPAEPPAAFRCVVGKGDGSDLGDGILYQVAVADEQGNVTPVAQRVVAKHEWLPLEADLTPWAGKTIRLKLIADVGEADNSSGDWACWADLRIESRDEQLQRSLLTDAGAFATEPGPYPVEGLRLADLRAAKAGWLRYDGCGLSGTGEYATYAVVNDVELGEMAPAGGREAEGVWEERVGVPLTPDAIATLARRNVVRVLNPHADWYKIRRFWIELELADGRRASSRISTATFTQPPNWPYFEGIGVPHGQDVTVDVWFDLAKP